MKDLPIPMIGYEYVLKYDHGRCVFSITPQGYDERTRQWACIERREISGKRYSAITVIADELLKEMIRPL